MRFILVAMVAGGASLFAQGVDYKYDFGARLEYDIGQFKMADETYTESAVRRARVSHDGSFYDKKLFYELEVDLTNYTDSDEYNELKYKDNLIGYKDKINALGVNYRIKVGNIKVPFSFDSYAGSKYSSFMESPLTDTFTQSRKIGIETVFSKKIKNQHVNLFLGAFQNSIDEENDNDEQKTRKVIKTTYDYKFDKNHLLHFGVSYLNSDINGENVKYSQEAESSLIKEKYVSTKVKDVDSTKDISLELMYIKNSFNIQAEYIKSDVYTPSNNYSFDGYYVQSSYFLFGSSKKYKQSSTKFSGSKIKNNEVEVAFRYSYINLNDKDEQGGTQKDYNFGVNYYLNKNIKFMGNYIVAYPTSDEYNGDFDLLQVRAVLTF